VLVCGCRVVLVGEPAGFVAELVESPVEDNVVTVIGIGRPPQKGLAVRRSCRSEA